MEITEVRIKLMEDNSGSNERLQAFCSITFDDMFVIRDLKIIEGAKGFFVAMPSRKLTDRCHNCGTKNHLRSRFCNQCGCRLDENRALRDADGRAKLHADIAHPINSMCREKIQAAVLASYAEELERSKMPGYVSRYDDYEADDFDVAVRPARPPRRCRPATSRRCGAARCAATPSTPAAASRCSAGPMSPTRKESHRGRRDPTTIIAASRPASAAASDPIPSPARRSSQVPSSRARSCRRIHPESSHPEASTALPVPTRPGRPGAAPIRPRRVAPRAAREGPRPGDRTPIESGDESPPAGCERTAGIGPSAARRTTASPCSSPLEDLDHADRPDPRPRLPGHRRRDVLPPGPDHLPRP